MQSSKFNSRGRSLLSGLTAGALALGVAATAVAQDPEEWFTLGGDFAHTRYSPADEITAENFTDLEVAWEWDGASFALSADALRRRLSTASYSRLQAISAMS
jgi:quinoprotein glucose dehydrogenase